MATTIRYLILLFVVTIISFSPLFVGVLPIIPGAVIPIFIILFAIYAFWSRKTKAKQRNDPAVTILTLTLCELISRPIMAFMRDDRPEQISPHSMARLPQVYRYLKNVNYEGTYYGDLAIMARKKEWREPRNLRFVTDATLGFRLKMACTVGAGTSLGYARGT